MVISKLASRDFEMNSEEKIKWQLTRERFKIEEKNPPDSFRPERHIKEIIEDLLHRTPGTPKAPDSLAERWPFIAGEQIAQHTRPAFLKKDILYVYADHPGWLAEIKRISKAVFIKKISSVRGLPPIRDIRFQLDPAYQSLKR